MANTVIALRSSGVTGNTPSLGVLANGELSLNFADGILYYKSSSNTLGSIRTTAVSGLTTEVQFNDAGSFGSNSNFTFNKTLATLNVKNINVSTNLIATTANLTVNSITTGTGTGGTIAGANVIYSNVFVANSGGYVQFADGSKQYSANASLSNNQILAGLQTVSSTANITFDYVAASNNGYGQNFKVGDDAWIGDTNVSNTIRIKGQQDAANAYIMFGNNDGVKLGREGSGPLTYSGGIATSQYIQFSDGSKQYTANAGGGSFGTDSFARTQANAAFDKANTAYSAATTAQGTADSAASTATAAYNTYDIASLYTPNNSTTVSATGRSDTFNLVGEAGIFVYSNSVTKTVTFAGGIQSLPGANGMTVDYGYVTEAIFYNIDYGTL